MSEDTVWKEVLDRYFEDFLRFFFPQVHRDIDWSRRPQFLDKELETILRGGPKGRQYVDKLVKVRLRDGRKTRLLLHLEVEGRAGTGFSRRMHVCNHRIEERYGDEVVSLAVLTHAGARYKVEPFERRRWGYRHIFEAITVKLSKYRGREAALARSRNPFALLVLAHLRRQAAKRDVEGLLAAKKECVAMLYERRYRRDDILHLFRFLDWLLKLPPGPEERFEEWVRAKEKAKTMPYVTSIEKSGFKRGVKSGIKTGIKSGIKSGIKTGQQQTLREEIVALLQSRFGRKGLQLLATSELPEGISRLRRIFRHLIQAADLPAAARVIEQASRARRST
jgi:hypothetical protein